MSDLISRKEAIKFCYDLINAENPSDEHDHWNYSQERINQTEVILHHLEFMPSAQLERKTGQWIDAVLPNDNGGLPVQVCDQCNTFFPLAYTGGGHHFCPNCGAKMEGGEQK